MFTLCAIAIILLPGITIVSARVTLFIPAFIILCPQFMWLWRQPGTLKTDLGKPVLAIVDEFPEFLLTALICVNLQWFFALEVTPSPPLHVLSEGGLTLGHTFYRLYFCLIAFKLIAVPQMLIVQVMSQGWKQMDYKTHLHNVVMVFAYPLALLYTWDISPSHKPSFFTSLLHFHPRPSTPNPIHLQHRGWIILFSSMVTNDPISTSVSAPCVNLDLKRCWNHKGDFGHASQVLQAHEDLWWDHGVFIHVLHAGSKFPHR